MCDFGTILKPNTLTLHCDKLTDVKEIDTETIYISKILNLNGVVPANTILGTDANFNVIGNSLSFFNPAYWCYNNGINPFLIQANTTVPLDFAKSGTLLEATPNMNYDGSSILNIADRGIYFFTFSCEVRVNTTATIASCIINFENLVSPLPTRVFRIGEITNTLSLNDRRILTGSFITSNAGSSFGNWRIVMDNQYPTQTITLTNMNTSIYKISNIP
jgi:hypothetical protein